MPSTELADFSVLSAARPRRAEVIEMKKWTEGGLDHADFLKWLEVPPKANGHKVI